MEQLRRRQVQQLHRSNEPSTDANAVVSVPSWAVLVTFLAATVLLTANSSIAQPAEPQPIAKPKVRDEQTLANELALIVDDPSIRVTDEKSKPLALALMTEGLKQIDEKNYDQALANFLEAYAAFPSPKILLNIGSTLREMGRGADAANTYQRYLIDPGSGSARASEVKALLDELDSQLTILVIRVTPRGSDVSIDGGPFVTIGSSFLTRVRPGLHMVRMKKAGFADSEITINGFEGERKNIDLILAAPNAPEPVEPLKTASLPSATTPTELLTKRTDASTNGWLVSGTGYSVDDGADGMRRRLRKGYSGPVVAAVVRGDPFAGMSITTPQPQSKSEGLGVIAQFRFDFANKGAAAFVGLALPFSKRLSIDAGGLLSGVYGGYVGLRLKILTGPLRPYVAGGSPILYAAERVRIAAHGSAGLELKINGYISAMFSVAYEHFFNPGEALVQDYFLPTAGVIGRL